MILVDLFDMIDIICVSVKFVNELWNRKLKINEIY